MGVLLGVDAFKAKGFAQKLSAFIKAPLETITRPLRGALDAVAKRLPFGLDKVVKPYINKFMGKAEAWLSKGPIAGFFGLLQKIGPTAKKLDDALHVVDRALPGGIKGLSDSAWHNLLEGVAHAQGRQVNRPVVTPATPITPGQRVERTLQVPCALEFDIKGINPVGVNGDKAHLAWAYSKSFNGGNVTPGGGYCFGARDYKVKQYDKDGRFIRDQRYSVAWDPNQTYRVRVGIEAGRTTYTVSSGGKVLTSVELGGAAPQRVTLGYGWPPSTRPGIAGAMVSNVVWGGQE